MSAREPRRSFAAPFVITVVAACGGPTYTNPPHPNPPGPDDAPAATGGDPQPGDTTWSLASIEGGCQAFRNVECPTEAGATCNPPPPQGMRCPEGVGDAGGKIVQPQGTTDCFLLHAEEGAPTTRTPTECPPN